MTKKNPLALYVHVPFCIARCGYCDFCAFSVGVKRDFSPQNSGITLDNYHEYIIQELNLYRNLIAERAISSIFFGGGTPSLLSLEQFAAIFKHLEPFLSKSDMSGLEISVEANPDTLTKEYVQGLKVQGVTRLSIGVQSFDVDALRTLERRHSQQQVENGVKWSKEVGMQVSMDLIYGTPNESVHSWQNTVSNAINLQPDHISAYALTLEPDTRLARKIARGSVSAIDDDEQVVKYVLADKMLTAAGYKWYEISNWSRGQKFESRHNKTYWKNGEYLGVGPGAHSHMEVQTLETRFWNTSSLKQYAIALASGKKPVKDSEVIADDEHRLESAMLFARQDNDFGLIDKATLQKLHEQKFVGVDGHLTIKGRMQNDQVVQILVNTPQTNKQPNVLHTSTNADANQVQPVKSCPYFQTARCRSCPVCIMD